MYAVILDMSNYLRPSGLEPIRLLCPSDSPVTEAEVGCHALLPRIFLFREGGFTPSLHNHRAPL